MVFSTTIDKAVVLVCVSIFNLVSTTSLLSNLRLALLQIRSVIHLLLIQFKAYKYLNSNMIVSWVISRIERRPMLLL
jgi:hypothetical protein